MPHHGRMPPPGPAPRGQSSSSSIGGHSHGGSNPDQQSRSASSRPMNGNWQSSKDMGVRREMIQNIVQLLKRSKKKGDITTVLPQMVKQLEVTLYRSAPSFEAYIDKSTLKERLQSIATEISNDVKNNKNRIRGNGHDNNGMQNLGPPPSGDPMSHQGNGMIPGPGPMGPLHGGPVPPGHYPPSGYNHGPPQSQMPPQSMNRGGKDLVNLGNVNRDMMGANTSNDNGMNSSGSMNNAFRNMSGTGSLSEGTSASRSENISREHKERLRKQQQRLLLLHHSSKCQAPEGKCTKTPYCREMKRLWLHMAKCEDYNCRVHHCYSSRTILSHYRKCKDQECEICKPVRLSVWRSKAERNSSDQMPSLGPVPERENPPPPHSYASSHMPYIPQPPPGGPPPGPLPVPSNQYPSQPNHLPPQNHLQPQNHVPSQPPLQNNVPMPPPIYRPESQNSGVISSTEPPSNSVENIEWKKRIAHKQQRLLLLRHASKCTAPEGKCEVTPHCHNMKLLWHHISKCSKKDCDEPHCISSRYVLMHYRKCKDVTCPSCQPVREAIRKGNENKAKLAKEASRKRPLEDQHISEEVNSTSQIVVSAPTSSSPIQKRHRPSEKKADDHTSTLLKSLTVEQIELHIQSLSQVTFLPPKVLKDKCQGLLTMLRNHDDGWVFNAPVDPLALGLPDYFERIKNPMDLGTINKRLDSGYYREIKGFDHDIRLTFDNAMLYNEPKTPVHEMAKGLKDLYLQEYTKLIEGMKREEEERRQSDRACALCGCEKLQFEPPVFFCSGMNCQSKRIHRNRHFYVGGNQYNWCTSCYNELDDSPIHLQDLTLMKKDLVKKKNDETNEETWVQCDACDRWMHQICGLFNPRQNKNDDSVKYTCPLCLLDERKNTGTPPDTRNPTAEDLPRTKFSEWLEDHVSKKVQEKYEQLALEKSQSEDIPYDEALKRVSCGGKITIRQVTSGDKKLEVRERMRKRYAHKNYPEEFPYRCKCILVFQNLDGVDVVLFALYVYEHDEKNPAPNSRTVYISYLDSVYYMRPRNLRTFVYHEILISYLDYARKRGFATVHIWACPPLKGDDYIFYAKPEDQKTPKDHRLRQWYIEMLVECQKRNIVGRLTNMYDLYFAPGNMDATVVPYLEGDYFSGEVEAFIKDVEDGKGKGGKAKNKSKKKGNPSDKTKKMRKGTRSGGLDDDFIKGDDPESIDSANDPVMKQLGDFIKPMKESFIVAFLNCEGAKPENLQVPRDIEEERQRRNELKFDRNVVDQERNIIKKDKNGNTIKIIDDDAEELECEILETRQDFLNLCRKNHYQFDQQRRAKHTSMMILWHLHNPDAAKIVQMCAACGKDILSGVRYNCPHCTDYDLCAECYNNPNTNRGSCTHELVPKSVDGDANQNGAGGSAQLTEAQRKERRHHIKLHIQLLEHASLCNSQKCTSSNCAKMKQYLAHSATCTKGHQGGCKICKRILSLLKYHALSCKSKACPIPNCDKVKERLRQMRRQQQAMDDRRRQVMNRQYRMGHPQN